MKSCKKLLPLVHQWVKDQEHRILAEGVSLSSVQIQNAINLGLKKPENIRLLKVQKIPVPMHPLLLDKIKDSGLQPDQISGLTFRYGICIRKDRWSDDRLIYHELVHTWQYERLGGIEAFVDQYLQECLTLGYCNSPLEQEAMLEAMRLYPFSNSSSRGSINP